jgi:hypothetical protein
MDLLTQFTSKEKNKCSVILTDIEMLRHVHINECRSTRKVGMRRKQEGGEGGGLNVSTKFLKSN